MMLPLFSSSSSSSSSSWVSFTTLKPRRRSKTQPDDFVSSISSVLSHIALTFIHLKSHALLKSHDSNLVVVYTIWEHELHMNGSLVPDPQRQPNNAKNSTRFLDSLVCFRHSRAQDGPPEFAVFKKALSTVAHKVDMRWYEVSCWDCNITDRPLLGHDQQLQQTTPKSPSPSPLPVSPQTLSQVLSPDSPSPSPSSVLTSSPCSALTSSPSSALTSSPCSALTSSLSLASSLPTSSSSSSSSATPCLSVGDIVHLRTITGEPPTTTTTSGDDVLDYSCLAILKSFVHQIPGIRSYTFFKSLDRPPTKMVGLGVWDDFNLASKFLYAPDGVPEECYWRSLGAKVKLGIYHVVFITSNGKSEL